jgi:hypothetical protein
MEQMETINKLRENLARPERGRENECLRFREVYGDNEYIKSQARAISPQGVNTLI